MAIDPIFGSLITGGASILGAVMNSNSSARAARLNAIAQANEANAARDYNKQESELAYARALEERQVLLGEAERERSIQREFAQQGIKWRADDARAAGIHPLAALGAQTYTYSPVQVGGTSGYSAQQMPRHSPSPFVGSSVGSGVAALGQDIGRALQATRTESERQEAYLRTSQDLHLQNQGLQNQLLASQIAKINQPGSPPAFPRSTGRSSGQGDDPFVKDEALKRVIANPLADSQEPAPVTDVGYTRTRVGYAPVYSEDAKKRLEDDEGGMLAWNLRNRLLPSFGLNYNLPGGAKQGDDNRYWFYNPFSQEYVQSARQRSYTGRPRGRDNYMRIN